MRLLAILDANKSGYAEANGNTNGRFKKKLENENGFLKARFCKLPRDSDSDSGFEATGSGRPMKFPCNL
ncbi:hypothetical protein Bca101_053272 [Brassica carinata]